jgi:uncharacterized protein (TIGR02145 family)
LFLQKYSDNSCSISSVGHLKLDRMKRKLNLLQLFILSCILITIPGCKEKEVLPALTTSKISDVTEQTAYSGGTITDDGHAMVTQRGVCWSQTANPTIFLSTRTNDGAGLGMFTSYIIGLTTGQTYHVRAYATNSVGTAYGADVSFTTRLVVAPKVTSTVILAVSSRSVFFGGTVTDSGGATQLERGVCCSKDPMPVIGSSAFAGESGDIGEYNISLTGLNAGTLYYARAYATNLGGTSYGDQITFTTGSNITDIEGTVYGTVTIGTQVWLTENLATTKFNDDNPIPLVTDQTAWKSLTSPGFCWYNNDGPTFKPTNGALYNWHAVSTGKLCPAGWHVPSDPEWSLLTTFLGGESVAGHKLRAYSNSPENSLFWALVCGTRDTITGFEAPEGCGGLSNSRWWSSTPSGAWKAWFRWLSSSTEIFRVDNSKKNGFSVRCIKNQI